MLRKLIIVSCLCLPLLSFSNKKKKSGRTLQQASVDHTDYRQLHSPLVPMRVVSSQGKIITNKTVANDANLFVMMFNPMCEHCEDMTADIIKHIGLFRKSKVVLVAAASMGPYIKDFEKNFKMDKDPALMIGLDSSNIMDKLFNYNTLPQINIYNHDGKLIRTINAQETVDSLRQYIE